MFLGINWLVDIKSKKCLAFCDPDIINFDALTIVYYDKISLEIQMKIIDISNFTNI